MRRGGSYRVGWTLRDHSYILKKKMSEEKKKKKKRKKMCYKLSATPPPFLPIVQTRDYPNK